MKIFRRFIIVFIFCFSIFGLAKYNSYSEGNGIWKLESTDKLEAGYGSGIETTISDGFSSYKRSDDDEVFSMSFVWTPPKGTYAGGELIEIQLDASIDSYVYAGNFAYMGGDMSARIDDPDIGWGFSGNSNIPLTDSSGENRALVSGIQGEIKIPSQSISVSAPFESGTKDGQKKSIYVSTEGGTMRYNYVWNQEQVEEESLPPEDEPLEEETTVEKTITVSGQVESIDLMPMVRMPINVKLYKDGASIGSVPEDEITLYTDIEGTFKADLSFEYDGSTSPVVLVEGIMKCVLPGDKETFHIVDALNDDVDDPIMVSSIIDIGEEELEASDTISVNRLFSFYYMYPRDLTDTSDISVWSFNDDYKKDGFKTNSKNPGRVALASYHYRLAWDAQFFGGVFFNEVNDLRSKNLEIKLFWNHKEGDNLPSVSHFSPSTNTIRITSDLSQYDDKSRFTTLHEYGHYFDSVTNEGMFRTLNIGPKDSEDTNHGGYMNSTTDDSFLEGFATNYCGIVQDHMGIKNPHIVGNYDISANSSGNYLAWDRLGKDEELAIARLLFGVYPYFDTPEDYWKTLEEDKQDFYAYYNVFQESLKDNTDGKNELERITEIGGLYNMPFGDGKYNIGEPFRDKNSNGTFDNGELFGDLMFKTYNDSNIIERGNPIRQVGNLKLGKVSDALRDRSTIYQFSNSYIYLSGEVPSHMVVTKSSGDDIISKQLVAVEGGNKVYIHTPRDLEDGVIEISVPGGAPILGLNNDDYYEHLDGTMGRSEPIDEIYIAIEDIPDGGLNPEPINGDFESDGHISEFRNTPYSSLNAQAASIAASYNPDDGLEGLDGEVQAEKVDNTEDTELIEEDESAYTEMILLIGLFIVLILIFVIGYIIRRKRNR